jgi:hypothetical protein
LNDCSKEVKILAYIKTRFKIPITEKYDNSQLIVMFEKDIPLLWLKKQYNRTIRGKPKKPIFKFVKCECLEKGKCMIIYMSEPFFNWLKLNYKQYRLL